MPLYEYLCANCAHQCEQLESIHADKCQTCPNCKNKTLNRHVSQTSFQLKGSGWYVTDFKNNDKKKSIDDKKTSTNKKEDSTKN